MYYGGVVTAMAGGSYEHGVLAGNLLAGLHAALRGRGCRVVGSDVMFETGSQEMYTYPDITVGCDPEAKMPGRPRAILSPSTEAKDRGEKSYEYRLGPTLRQYALVCQDKPLIEIHTRGEDGVWRISEVSGLDADCAITSLDCSVPMAALYEGVLES